MSDLSFEDLEMDDYQGDSYEFGEGYEDESSGFDVEGYDDESTLTNARRRRAQLELARRRRIERARATRGTRSPTKALAASNAPAARAAAAAVRNVGIESKIQDDMLRGAIEAQNRRMARSEMATVASVVASQLQASLQGRIKELQNPYVGAGLRAAPLLLLSPRKRGTGATAFLTDPRVIGAAAALTIAFAGDRAGRSDVVRSVRMLGPSKVKAAATSAFLATALDSRGTVVSGKAPLFQSSDSAVATVNPLTGQVTGVAKGDVFITVTVDGVPETVFLTVE